MDPVREEGRWGRVRSREGADEGERGALSAQYLSDEILALLLRCHKVSWALKVRTTSSFPVKSPRSEYRTNYYAAFYYYPINVLCGF